MSTDFIAVCDVCKLKIHAGQTMAGGNASFGYGSSDEFGRGLVAAFLFRHAYCDENGGARVLIMDVSERRPCDEYREPMR